MLILERSNWNKSQILNITSDRIHGSQKRQLLRSLNQIKEVIDPEVEAFILICHMPEREGPDDQYVISGKQGAAMCASMTHQFHLMRALPGKDFETATWEAGSLKEFEGLTNFETEIEVLLTLEKIYSQDSHAANVVALAMGLQHLNHEVGPAGDQEMAFYMDQAKQQEPALPELVLRPFAIRRHGAMKNLVQQSPELRANLAKNAEGKALLRKLGVS
jgi:hypothetical protein